MQEIENILADFIELVSNHQIYGELYNYEPLVKKEFELLGKGALLIDASAYVQNFLDKSKGKKVEIFAIYQSLNESLEDVVVNDAVKYCAERYDPLIEYILMVGVDRDKLSPNYFHKLEKRSMFIVKAVEFTQPKRPSKLSCIQIRKRLNRMVQQGKYLLVLDTSNPDFMGKNLALWLAEIEALQKKGKHLSVIIDSKEKLPQTIPEYLSEKIITVPVK